MPSRCSGTVPVSTYSRSSRGPAIVFCSASFSKAVLVRVRVLLRPVDNSSKTVGRYSLARVPCQLGVGMGGILVVPVPVRVCRAEYVHRGISYKYTRMASKYRPERRRGPGSRVRSALTRRFPVQKVKPWAP
ncbi:hypothetical protein V8C34DRAFT_277643 [Trichoderma compactum]